MGYGEHAAQSDDIVPPKAELDSYPTSPPMQAPHGAVSPPPSYGEKSPNQYMSRSPPHRPPRPESLDLDAIRFARLPPAAYPSNIQNPSRIPGDRMERNSESSDKSWEQRERELYYRYAKQKGFNIELLTRVSMRDDPVLRENARKKLSPEPLRIIKRPTGMSEPERRVSQEYSGQERLLSDGHYDGQDEPDMQSRPGTLGAILEGQASSLRAQAATESSIEMREFDERELFLLGN